MSNLTVVSARQMWLTQRAVAIGALMATCESVWVGLNEQLNPFQRLLVTSSLSKRRGYPVAATVHEA
jgi:hypothetical protein